MISLARAVLCVNCEFITDSRGEKCVRCASGPLMSLANVLDRTAQQAIEVQQLEHIWEAK